MYINVSDKGYDCIKNNAILFSTDESHYYLFDYIAKDLSSLPELFKQYVSKRLDTTTFEEKEDQNKIDELNSIKEILVSAHPYYEYAYKEVILNAIGKYFNELLVYSIFEKNLLSLDRTLEKKWYYSKLTCLMPRSVVPYSCYPTGFSPLDFYNKYKDWVDCQDYSPQSNDEELVIYAPHEMPVGFSEEIQLQNWAHGLLYFLLDRTAEHLKDLTLSQRIWLYGNIFHSQEPKIQVVRNLRFSPLAIYSILPDSKRNTFNEQSTPDYRYKMQELFYEFYVNRFNAKDGIPTNLVKPLSDAIKYVKTLKTETFHEEYKINNFQDLLSIEIMLMIQSGTRIRRCDNCGKYFVSLKRNTKYCKRNGSGLSCADEIRRKRSQKKYEENPEYKLYNRAYKKNYARVSSKTITQDEFYYWDNIAKAKRDQVMSGKIGISDFNDWLDQTNSLGSIKKLSREHAKFKGL